MSEQQFLKDHCISRYIFEVPDCTDDGRFRGLLALPSRFSEVKLLRHTTFSSEAEFRSRSDKITKVPHMLTTKTNFLIAA